MIPVLVVPVKNIKNVAAVKQLKKSTSSFRWQTKYVEVPTLINQVVCIRADMALTCPILQQTND